MYKGLIGIISLLVGTTFVIGTVIVDSDDLVKNAMRVVNDANIHQLATALEVYYADHNVYPQTEDGEALVVLLEDERYIRNRPLDSTVFFYRADDDGQDYTLKLNPCIDPLSVGLADSE